MRIVVRGITIIASHIIFTMYQVLAVAHGVVWLGALLGHHCLASFAYDTLKLAKLYHIVKVCHHSFRGNK